MWPPLIHQIGPRQVRNTIKNTLIFTLTQSHLSDLVLSQYCYKFSSSCSEPSGTFLQGYFINGSLCGGYLDYNDNDRVITLMTCPCSLSYSERVINTGRSNEMKRFTCNMRTEAKDSASRVRRSNTYGGISANFTSD